MSRQLLNYCFGMQCISTRLVHNDTVFPKRSRQGFVAFFIFLNLIHQRPSLPKPCERLASDRSSWIHFACVWHCYPAQRDQSKDSSPQSMFKGSISFKVFGYKLTLVIEISDRDSDDIFDRHSKVRRFLYIGSMFAKCGICWHGYGVARKSFNSTFQLPMLFYHICLRTPTWKIRLTLIRHLLLPIA